MLQALFFTHGAAFYVPPAKIPTEPATDTSRQNKFMTSEKPITMASAEAGQVRLRVVETANREDGAHLVFVLGSQANTKAVLDGVEAYASKFYDEARAGNPGLQPNQLHFYIHKPATGGNPDHLVGLLMHHEGGKYQCREFVPLDEDKPKAKVEGHQPA